MGSSDKICRDGLLSQHSLRMGTASPPSHNGVAEPCAKLSRVRSCCPELRGDKGHSDHATGPVPPLSLLLPCVGGSRGYEKLQLPYQTHHNFVGFFGFVVFFKGRVTLDTEMVTI